MGGVLRSVEMDGFVFDKGCHLFSNEADTITEIMMEILDGEYEPVHVKYASIINRKKTDGFAIPDFCSFGEDVSRQVLWEILEAAAAQPSESRNLQEVFDKRFGPTAGGLLTEAARKMYRLPPEELDAGGFGLSFFHRIRFIEDEAALVLKQSPPLDERIAASSQNDPLKFYRDTATKHDFRNYYPTGRGLLKFCENAERKLAEAGVTVRCGSPVESLEFGDDCKVAFEGGETLTGDRVLWTGEIEKLTSMLRLESAIGDYIKHVPMVLYYFVIERGTEGPYTYLHSFDAEDIVFRASVPGSYVEDSPCPEGKTYVCCEVPTDIGSPEWENKDAYASKAWEELQRHGVVTGDQPLDTKAFTIPVTYKMPKIGYWTELEQIEEVANKEPRLIGATEWDFSKNDIIRTILRCVD